MKTMKRMALTLAAILLASLSIVHLAYADIYKWVDGKGGVHFTQDPSTIPEKYRDSTTVRSEDSSRPTTQTPKKPIGKQNFTKESVPTDYYVAHPEERTRDFLYDLLRPPEEHGYAGQIEKFKRNILIEKLNEAQQGDAPREYMFRTNYGYKNAVTGEKWHLLQGKLFNAETGRSLYKTDYGYHDPVTGDKWHRNQDRLYRSIQEQD